jgi:hypothetical protein
MPRQPIAGAGAAGRAPSGAAARAPAPSASSPLPTQRYRALRARYNALLVALYERSSLTLREIAVLAGRTDRAVQMLVRALGCLPRNARTCRPGTNVGVRRAGEKSPPLNAPATRRVAAAFAAVARELAASPEMREASELQRATARAERRTARTQTRMMASAARELAHLAAAIEGAAAAKLALAAGPKRARQPASAPKRLSREDMRRVQERALREGEAQMYAAHRAQDLAARRAKAAAATPPALDPEIDRRVNESAARHDAKPWHGPRIRRL